MVIASIDLVNGKAVQFDQEIEQIVRWDEPLLIAQAFDKYSEITVVDLDAEINRGENLETIKKILRVAECRVGGGIRTIEKAKELISLGAKKIIIGSKAFENDQINHDFLQELVSTMGRYRVIIAIDVLNGVEASWRLASTEKYASEFLFTFVEKEKTLGIPFHGSHPAVWEGRSESRSAGRSGMEMVRELRRLTRNKITVACGVSSIDEIRELSKIGVDVQIDMALYTGRINLAEAFIESLNWKSVDGLMPLGATTNELMPTITQDYTGEVLMLAYSNRDSLKKTFETGNMWYFSRSRNKLWMKGETSGNVQEFIRMRADCDRDALIATVKQKGVACHKGAYSCFGDRRFSLYELYEVIKDRIENPSPQSYTAQLTDELLKEKLLEEAHEVVEAKVKDEIVWEAADVIYFLMVLLAKNGVEINDVLFELSRRRKR